MQNDIQVGDVVFLRTYEDMSASYPPEPNCTTIYYGPFTAAGARMNIIDSIIPYLGEFYTVQDIDKKLPFPRYKLKGVPWYFGREALIPSCEMEEPVPWADVIGKVIS